MNSPRLIPSYHTAIVQNRKNFFFWGLALVVLGMIAISAATMTTILSVIFLGSLLLVGGAFVIIDALTCWWKKWSGFLLVFSSGVLYLLLGIMLVTNPLLASVSLTLFLGVFYLIIGVMRLAYSIFMRVPNWGWGFISGLISLMLGILILSNLPQSSLFIIGLFVGIDLIFVGWSYIMTSFAAKILEK